MHRKRSKESAILKRFFEVAETVEGMCVLLAITHHILSHKTHLFRVQKSPKNRMVIFVLSHLVIHIDCTIQCETFVVQFNVNQAPQ
jgi:hypothetical protein